MLLAGLMGGLVSIGGVGNCWEGVSCLLTASGLMDYDKKMQKNVVKFGAGVLGLMIAGGAVWYGVLLYQERQSPEYALKQEYEKLMEQYRNDTYGGDTPEETLRLFIDALKAGDTDLAAKYFVVEEWEKMKKELENAKSLDQISGAIQRLEAAEFTKKTEDRAYLTLSDKNKMVISEMIFSFHALNKIWKILEL